MAPKQEFKTTAMFKQLMSQYYAQGVEARRKNIPVAWVTAVFPVEILYAAEVFPYYPENFGALAAARKIAHDLSELAEAKGYFYDLCGYARCGIGDAYAQEHPVGEIERPDIIFCCNTQCGSLPKWFEAASRFYNAPYFLLDAPLIEDAWEEQVKKYFIKQLEEMIDFLEQSTGKAFDYNRLVRVLDLSNEACRLWNEILDTAALKPAPFGFFDACFHMAPIVTWRGTEEAVTYYRALKEELDERIKKGIYAIPNERYKIYWDHIPVWPRLRWFADLFAEHGALVVVSQYTHSWAYNFDPSNPLESLADNYLKSFVNRSFDKRIDLKINFMKKYNVDGFVLFSNRSCKPNAFGLYDKSNVIKNVTGLPGVVFEADMSDLRFFSEEQVRSKIEVFVEQLKER
ncbi:2-hydroxyacyl-CoA dehydratase subunit D [Desulfoscipio gibsoniae]|uniref:Benzoyl-CoA reductase/2-hydroxyglutaryl-CoA dehydratase subunit, BcrC/BadD/HgdB n=1 Tax=Desulfoscipio gibsoniae DSM 7213 TaxID=767817 RepID=R4KMQ4_9FIRM|nr:2-hydroxyacyl-CoA dehydratase family protein [Desulfoscipio gibsoniae]AGL00911.1 Benzoyl-CoA reductase/2-hydroxyglutaryl-CoA dehydratase subunit, BcrC/BadD/HgdB [Desulfoscipio gibsoniae DSM 7213]